MRPSASVLLLALVACDSGPPPEGPPPLDAQPLTPPSEATPTPEAAADPRADACPVFFSGDDANAVFGVAGSWSSGGCAFDGVRVKGSTLTLTWKDAQKKAVTLAVAPAKCSDAPAVGGFTLVLDDGIAAACPEVPGAVEAALKDGRFPSPTGTRVAEGAGPDGSGDPGSTVAEELPPRQPTDAELPPLQKPDDE